MANKVPKIRFKDFTDDWEQRKLKELGDIQTGNTPSTSNADNYSIDGMLWVTPTDIKSLVISDTSKKLSEAGVLKARIAKAGSILVTSIASIGKNTLVTKDVGFNQQINALTPTNNNDSYFLLTQSEKWSAKMKQTAAAATMQIVNKTDFSNISTLVPVRKDEQKKIGTFFKQLDDLITLHQRKCDQTKELKKFMLQKMFPKKGEKNPEIRFSGFTDDWEQRELGEIAARVQGNDGRMDLPTLTISAANGWMNQKERFSGNIAGKEQKNYTLLHKGELSYNHGNSKLAKYGAVFSLETYKEALVPRVYHSFKVIDGNPKFIEYYFATKIPDRELAKLVSSGARMDGLLNINFNEFMGINLTVPNKSEQEKISNYFSNLDHLITLHQRKCEQLKELKKFMLQNMFPKKG